MGFYARHTYYISFPTLNQTWAFRTTNNQWHGPLPYATTSVASIPSDPVFGNISTPGPFNSAIAVRSGTASVDSWLAGLDTDLGGSFPVLYQSADQPAQNPHVEKEYTHLAITHKVQSVASFCTVTIIVDDDITKSASVTFDMTLGPTQIATISYQGPPGTAGQGPLRGFVARLVISYNTVPISESAPIQIKSVVAYGVYRSRNLTPTVNM